MFANDLKSVTSLIKGMSKVGIHKNKLDNFYRPQASSYNDFRSKLLAGRFDMLKKLCIREGHSVADFGCGTGQVLDYLNPTFIHSLERVDLVDICSPLLDKAKEKEKNFMNVNVVSCSAEEYRPDTLFDRIYFSYSMTMMPTWFESLRNAYRLLKPSGFIGVVDFCSQPLLTPVDLPTKMSFFWTKWFQHSGVHLNRRYQSTLIGMFETVYHEYFTQPLPYLSFLKAPYYIFIGRK